MKPVGLPALIPAALLVGLSISNVNAQERLRLASYDAALHGQSEGEVFQRLEGGNDAQAKGIARLVQSIRPDVLLLSDIDFDDDSKTARRLASEYFEQSQGDGLYPIVYPFIYSIPSNSGVDSGLDLNDNGVLGEPEDAWGSGDYPGQHAMAVFSRYQIIEDRVRTFQNFLWKDVPGAQRPVDPETGEPYHDDETWDKLRLSSHGHADIPLLVIGRRFHILASHPTPPNDPLTSARNHDEIKFWVDYLAGEEGEAVDHIIDDKEKKGGLDAAELVVVMGNLNLDPADGEGQREIIDTLLKHERLYDYAATSTGGLESKQDDNGIAARDTMAGENGNMRLDYVIPDARLHRRESHVIWPKPGQPGYELLENSDHRMVWIKVEVP